MAIGVAEAPVEVTADQSDVAGRSLRSIVWGRLRRDKTAMISMIGILIILLGAIFAPLITRLMGVDPYSFNGDLLSDAGSLPLGNWGGITWQHPLGVEPQTGRDIFARLLYGARLSLFIALTATVITMVLGTLAGIVAGYRGGWVDTLISRLSDLTLVFPSLVLLIALGPVAQQWATELGLEPNTGRVVFIILVLGVFSWAYLGRIVRGQVLSLREREFVEAAESLGARPFRVLFVVHRHRGDSLLPRRRRAAAHAHVGQHAGGLGEVLHRRPHLPLHPRQRPARDGAAVQPARRLHPRRHRPSCGARVRTEHPQTPARHQLRRPTSPPNPGGQARTTAACRGS